MNLWIFRADPKIGSVGRRPYEVIFNKFAYTPNYQFDWGDISWVINDNTNRITSSPAIFSSKNVVMTNDILYFRLNANESGFLIGS